MILVLLTYLYIYKTIFFGSPIWATLSDFKLEDLKMGTLVAVFPSIKRFEGLFLAETKDKIIYYHRYLSDRLYVFQHLDYVVG